MDHFRNAVEELRAEKVRWDELGKLHNVSWEAHARMGATLQDILDFAPTLIEIHERARVAIRDDEIAASTALGTWSLIAVAGAGNDENRNKIARLGVAYKAFFFFVRSHQDVLYATFLNLLGLAAGPGARMTSALKEANPVGELLKTKSSGYLPWFERWRELRNRVKFGVGLASLGPSANPGVSFTEQTPEGGLVIDLQPQNAVRLKDATEALRMTKEGLSVAVEMAEPGSTS